jgi:hypothetical protein
MTTTAWIIWLTLSLGKSNESHAFGPFSSERNCWRWAEMVNQTQAIDVLIECTTLEEFRRNHPGVRIEGGS